MTNNNLTIPNLKSPSRLFWVGVILASVWIGMNLVFPKIAPTGIPIIIARIIIEGVILTGLWLGLSRTTFTYRTRVTLWLVISIPFTLWFIFILRLAMQGVFVAAPGALRAAPTLPLAIFLPVVVVLILLIRSKRIASLLDVMPASWLVGIQLYRVLGGLFLVYWLHGIIPGAFALPAGIGDVLVGVLALPAAAMVASGTEAGRKVGVWWNILGLLDLANAIVMGIMTAPGGPLHAASQANSQLGAFPAVITPAFSVPVEIITHGLSIWQLKRQAHSAH